MNGLRIVLVRPSQPRNIGAVVRVCANFGAESLWLVGCPELDAEQEREARVASAGAWDVIGAPRVVQTLGDAISECTSVIGASARRRAGMSGPITPRDLAVQADNGLTAVVFGAESQGLSAAELAQCHRWMRIPVSERFPSMNLSHAVAVVCHAWYTHGAVDALVDSSGRAKVVAQEQVLSGLESSLRVAGSTPEEAARMSAQLRQLLYRAEATDEDLGLLHRIFRRLGGPSRK